MQGENMDDILVLIPLRMLWGDLLPALVIDHLHWLNLSDHRDTSHQHIQGRVVKELENQLYIQTISHL